jgi:hypothetical protein
MAIEPALQGNKRLGPPICHAVTKAATSGLRLPSASLR